MVDTKPMLPPGISPWNLGPWRGFEVETLAAVHSLWWFDEASRARRVLWPIWGRDESLVGWTSRLLDKVEDAPKYRNLPRMAALQTMWPVPTRNLESLDRSLCVIVEGIPDAIRLLALGVPTLSNLGTAWSHTRTAMLADLGFREVIVSCDGDAAGRKANLHIGYELRKAIGEKRVTVWEWSDSVDPGDAPEVEIDALLAELKLPKRPHPWLRCLPPLLPEWSL
jgi:DNA primase